MQYSKIVRETPKRITARSTLTPESKSTKTDTSLTRLFICCKYQIPYNSILKSTVSAIGSKSMHQMYLP